MKLRYLHREIFPSNFFYTRLISNQNVCCFTKIPFAIQIEIEVTLKIPLEIKVEKSRRQNEEGEKSKGKETSSSSCCSASTVH